MNIETLKCFQHIAKYKNITQASKHLFLSQSTLSRHIMALENELGVKLFVRNNKVIELTEAGRKLYDESDSLINHIESMTKDVALAGDGLAGILKIAMPKNLHMFIDKPLHDIRIACPSAHFFVEAYDFAEIHLAVDYHLYDAGITYDYAVPCHDEFNELIIGTDSFYIVYPKEFQRSDPKSTLSTLVENLPLISPPYTDPPFIQEMILAIEKQTGLKILDTMGTNTTDSLVLNVSLGLGYGLIPVSFARLLSDQNNLAFLAPPGVITETNVVAIYRGSHNSELKTFMIETFSKNTFNVTP